MKKIFSTWGVAFAFAVTLSSCDDYLDKEPLSSISPETYFTEVSQLKAYVDNYYWILPSHGTGNTMGIYGQDKDTDNQVYVTANNRFTKNLWKVSNNDSEWTFSNIYKLNYFLSEVLPRFGDSQADGSDLSGSKNTITGDINEIKHYIGEMYLLRALEYFGLYQKFGDFPIITKPLNDNKEELSEASQRQPRNEVARFILSDLDKAAELMSGKSMSTTRINRDVALLLKSRVALYEGTWLKYFNGTAFVPNGNGWPGKAKDYNANYQYPSGSIENEINYFLDQAMIASKDVAEKYKNSLCENTGVLQQSTSEPINPYYNMFAQEDLSGIKEVLLWRQYQKDLVMHNVNVYTTRENNFIGVTRSYVQNFLMADGTPVYQHGSYADGDGYYMGDKTIGDVRINRDSRLSLFLKEPGQHNILYLDPSGETAQIEEPYPILTAGSSLYFTGYTIRKGCSFYQKFCSNSKGYTGSISYRAVEALLNYMEASYERNGNLDNSATEYWKIIRRRSKVNDDIQNTINSTIMAKEAENDWAAYSGGKILSDATLYNIRRERRSEFFAEGLRYMDLCRWRSMDQLINTPYIPEGIHLWNTPMQSWYDPSSLVADGSPKANVSSPSDSEYLRPYRKTSTQNCYDGFTWKMAHYLYPIMVKQFLLTAPDSKTIEQSPIYQNPYWPTTADQPAEQ